MNDKEKIEKMLSELEIKAPTFAANIGVAYSRIHDIQREKTKNISGDLANAISLKYPQYSFSWLLSDGCDEPSIAETKSASSGTATQLELDFSKIADACQKNANSIMELISIQAGLARSNEKLAETNAKLVDQVTGTLARIEKKIDDREGVVSSTGGVLQTGR